jgi:hypothetical protein
MPFTHADSFVPLINKRDNNKIMNKAGIFIIPTDPIVDVSKGE